MAQAGLKAIELVGGSYRLLLDNWRSWLVALALPLAIDILTRGAFARLYGPQITDLRSLEQAIDGAFLFRLLALMVVTILAITLFSVSWHRLALLGRSPRLLPPIGANHVRFASASLTLVVLAVLIGQLVVVVALMGGSARLFVLLLAILTVILFLRWSMVFPAAALGERLSFAQSWRMTKGSTLTLFWALLLSMAPILFLGLVAGAVLGLLFSGSAAAPRGDSAV